MHLVFYYHIGGDRKFAGDALDREPMGGTESALIYITRALAELGHQVSVLNNCGDREGHYYGVNYFDRQKNAAKFLKNIPFDLLISVNDPKILAYDFGVPAVFWMHIDYSHLILEENRAEKLETAVLLRTRAARIFSLSRWQTEIVKNIFDLPEELFFITRNGVYLPYFENQSAARDPFRLIYTSVPDRGLDVLLSRIFPLVKAGVPEAKLEVFSGFKLWGIDDQASREKMAGLGMENNLPGVTFHDSIIQKDLAAELLKSWLWVYPNHQATKIHVFAETSCIAALEAQAAGLPAIASKRGALPETISDGFSGILIEGDAYSPEYQGKFAGETIRLLKNPAERNRLGGNAGRWVDPRYSWKTIAAEWVAEFARIISLPGQPPGFPD